jgi:hypothetical protein
MDIQEREHQKFGAQIVGLKAKLASPASEWFLESVLGVLRGDSRFWSDVSVEHSRSVVNTALAVLRPRILSIPESDRAILIEFFDYERSSDD